MSWVVYLVDPSPKYYGGYFAESFVDSGVLWFKTVRGRSVRFDEDTAEKAMDALRQMGFSVLKRKLRAREQAGGGLPDEDVE